MAFIHSISLSNFKIIPISEPFTSFEGIACSFSLHGKYIKLGCIYRPGHAGTDPLFINEFDIFMESFFIGNGPSFICGDFNYWLDDPRSKPYTSEFIDLLNVNNCINYVNQPTHIAGHTLDLVISQNESESLSNLSVFPIDRNLSDHSLITFNLNIIMSPAEPKQIKFRNYNHIDENSLKIEISQAMTNVNLNQSCNDLVLAYNNLFSSLADRHFPLIEKTILVKDSKPWFNSNINNLRKERRMAERVWRSLRTPESRDIYNNARSLVCSSVEDSKSNYFNSEIRKSHGNQKALWNVVNRLIGGSITILPDNVSDEILASNFNSFFLNKIRDIRMNLDVIVNNDSYSECYANFLTRHDTSTISEFRPITESKTMSLINQSHKTYSPLDPIDISKVPFSLDLVCPLITAIINTSFSSGIFPSLSKNALIKPLLKKPSLDNNELNNFRPVSKLTFISKVQERAILDQLLPHLVSNSCIPEFQSAYRSHHSTETALCRIYNDLVTNCSSGSVSALLLLDLSAAFDTIDHELLIDDLHKFGLKDNALSLLKSYLTGRHQSVSIGGAVSESQNLNYGVPQGSVLGPVLFTLYAAGLSNILKAHGVSFHFYADDTQIYLPISDIPASKAKLIALANDIKIWMIKRKLKLNEGKTELIFIRGSLRCSNVGDFGNLQCMGNVSPSAEVRNLGVVFDSNLTFSTHISNIVKVCNYQLRKLSCIKRYIDRKCLLTLLHSFITSRIDYCNSLFINLPAVQTKRLQTILNKCARLIFNLSPIEPTSQYLIQLHWLPLKARVEFKICLLVYKTLKYGEPKYLFNLLQPYSNVSTMSLRTSDDMFRLNEPKAIGNRSFGDRAFVYVAPRLYNKLPVSIKMCTTVELFKKKLKTHLFSKSYDLVNMTTSPEYRL